MIDDVPIVLGQIYLRIPKKIYDMFYTLVVIVV